MRGTGKNGKQAVIITSVVVGVISMLVMNLIKNRLAKIPFFTRLFKLQDIGVNSMQDFLEVSELNLRVDDESEGNIKAIYDGINVIWDSDGSTEYIVFISSEYIHKIKLLDSDNIDILENYEIDQLSASTNWIRKIIVRSYKAIFDDDSSIDSSSSIASDNENSDDSDEDNPNGIHKPRTSKIKPRRKHIKNSFPPAAKSKHNEKYGLAPTFCEIPFERFNCRVRSNNGRVSRHLTYPTGSKRKQEEKEIDAWVSKEGMNYYINMIEPDEKKASQIFEYQVVLYMADGKGAIRTIPPFSSMKFGINIPDKRHPRITKSNDTRKNNEEKNVIRVKLGPLPPCLCYITGIRGIGARFEQFVSWIGEQDAMTLNGELDGINIDELEFA